MPKATGSSKPPRLSSKAIEAMKKINDQMNEIHYELEMLPEAELSDLARQTREDSDDDPLALAVVVKQDTYSLSKRASLHS